MNVKICGLSEPKSLQAAITAGARYLGFVFFPKSPRNVSIEQASALAADVPAGLCKVALTVNATNAVLDEILRDVALDMLQLHGSETPERVSELKSRYGLPVMKAIGIADAEDLTKIAPYEQVADQLLIDAKPPQNADLPGGNGLSFDWRLIQSRRWATPWMLAGGLTPDNVAEAIELTNASQIDVSSGVESRPGVKDPQLIETFLGRATAKP